LVADLRAVSFSPPAQPLLGAFSTSEIQDGARAFGSAASQLSKRSRTAPSTSLAASAVASRSLVWPTNSGSRMNTDSIAAGAGHHVLAGDLLRPLLPASSP
jgi:hypothetical protein